ncbi:MAG: DUF4097 family beta strand repeat-containing protein [Clostridia bacterium]|nr:DUF4097 family beta strand repeat-containing protein [Clostridia bacterium]
MKEKRLYFETENDVVRIDCELISCAVEICGADDCLRVEKNKHSHIKISESGGIIKIKQTRKPLFKKAEVKIHVPAFCVPDLAIVTDSGTIAINHGIYGDLRIKAHDADISLSHSSFVNADLTCENIRLHSTDVSVRNALDCTAVNGEAIIDDSFCTRPDLRFKSGGMGITRLKCRTGYFSADCGSISLNLKGAKDDYTISSFTKYGTCNCPDTDGGKYSVKAYTGTGNIIIDFTDKKEVAFNGNDYVAEDTCLAREA